MFELFKQFVSDAPAHPANEHWRRLRRAPRGTDSALTGTTRRWLRDLPARRRPMRLCELYPRVANRIAWCWSDVSMSDSMLQDLLVDRRGGRLGFTPSVVREIQRLREFNAQQRAETSAETLVDIAARIVR